MLGVYLCSHPTFSIVASSADIAQVKEKQNKWRKNKISSGVLEDATASGKQRWQATAIANVRKLHEPVVAGSSRSGGSGAQGAQGSAAACLPARAEGCSLLRKVPTSLWLLWGGLRCPTHAWIDAAGDINLGILKKLKLLCDKPRLFPWPPWFLCYLQEMLIIIP